MTAAPPEFRQAIADLLGRPVPADEPVDDTITDLRFLARQQVQPLTWQFGKGPELVVHFPKGGSFCVARIAGGEGQAEIDDPLAREIIRALLRVATKYLDDTEPATTSGRSL